jgi:hypothetical protein
MTQELETSADCDMAVKAKLVALAKAEKLTPRATPAPSQ